MTKTIILALITFTSIASAQAQDVQCRRTFDAKAGVVTYSDEDLTSTVGDALPNPCMGYFMDIAVPETLPVVDGKIISVKLIHRVEYSQTMDKVMTIYERAPATKTRVEIGFTLEPDPDGMNTIRVSLTPKSNY